MSLQQIVIAVLLFILMIVGLDSYYVLDQRQQALVVQFGKPVGAVQTPGLKFKVPFIQDVVLFDNRILDLNTEPREVIASDQKRLIVDAYAKYRIVDPQKFYESVANEQNLKSRLNSILDSSLRLVIGTKPLSALLSDERQEIMDHIRTLVNQQVSGELALNAEGKPTLKDGKNTADLGIKVVDVRIMRADLPMENSEAIFRRMQTEREREAKEIRAEGAEQAKRVRSEADKQVKIILAEAEKEAQVQKGKGDAKATDIFAGAFNRDPEFFAFYRSMNAYSKGLNSENTTMILSPDSDFMKYFNSIQGAKR